jgi:FtsZ-interacting cell division protein YlmF
VANAAKAGKSVVLDLKNTKPELAKRVLDFSFGVASALNGTVDKAADRVFVFAQGAGAGLTQTERDYLFKQGVL